MLSFRSITSRLAHARPMATRSYHSGRSHFDPMMNKNGRIENLAIFGVGAAIVTAASIGVWLGSTWTKKPSSPKLETAHTNHTKLVLKTPEDKADETTRLLSEHAYSHEVKHTAGVTRFDGAQLASNSPCEDRFMYGKFPAPWENGTNKPWMAWGIFDGHAGWQTAELLEKHLLPFVQLGLSQIEPVSDRGFISASDKSIHRAITNGFLYLDDLIIHNALEISQNGQSLKEKMKVLAPAFAESCAILALYDPITRSLHVACTGDSRAVLGHRTPNGKWEAVSLSVDQTGRNKAEISRIAEEHPGEEGIIKKSRVLGLAVSRAFGDGRLAVTAPFSRKLRDDITISVVFFGGDSRNGNENELKGSNKMKGGDKFSGKDDWKGGAWSEMWPREY